MASDSLVPAAMLGRLRFRHLMLLSLIARTGNLHRAAEELNVTQPAATKNLQDIELILGVRVFDRHARGLTPTAIGTFVLGYAEQALSEQERFLKALGNLRRGGFGALSIGAIMATAPDLLPAAIAELKRRRPLLTITLSTTTSDQLLHALEKNELDLVIGRLTEARHAAIFEVEPLSIENLWAFVAAGHPLAGLDGLHLEQTGGLPWVLQPQTSPMRQVIDRCFADAGLAPPANMVETTSIFATLHLVQRAGMISVLPHTIIAAAVGRGELVRLDVAVTNPLGPYGVIRRRGEALSANAEEFVDVVRGCLHDG